jgi:hypothetical protein
MRVTIPDDIVDPYQAYANRQGRPVDDVVAAQLKRFKALEPGKKAIVLQADALTAVEASIGGLPLKDGADLLTRVEALAGLSFAHIKIDLSPAQKAELQHRAERQGRTVESLVREMVATITADLFWTTGGGPAAETSQAPRRKAG